LTTSIPVLAYHKVDPRLELGITSLPPRKFERQIKFLKHKGNKTVDPHCLINSLKSKRAFELDTKPETDSSSLRSSQINLLAKHVMITFDDGYEDIYNYAYPILGKYSYNATVFLTAGYIGKRNDWEVSPGPRFRHLNWSQVREMANSGVCFGSHGVNHKFLTKQNPRDARYEIEVSKKKLEDGLGLPVFYFSYPYGDYNEMIINLVQEAGYKAAFTLRPEFLKPLYNHNIKTIYALPRIAVYLIDSMWAFKTKTGYSNNEALIGMQKLKNRLINRCAYASMLVKKA
jgi:peptidoglycan/xylan/chitin deacetylase (PgdA/CDA1 family)